MKSGAGSSANHGQSKDTGVGAAVDGRPVCRHEKGQQARPQGDALPTGPAPSAGWLAGGLLLAGAALAAYNGFHHRHRLQTTRLRLPLARLPAPFAGVSVALISDLHISPFMGDREVRAAVDAVLALHPDIIAVTGDFTDRFLAGRQEVIARQLCRLRAPLGVYGVLGNHDHGPRRPAVADAVRRAGICLLDNASVRLERKGAALYVAGVDSMREDKQDLGTAMAGVPEDGCTILLAHEGDFADLAALDRRMALQLSGHSHGGQVRLPGWPLVLPRLGRKYVEGLFRVGQMKLYVNRGIGTASLPLRLNCPAELTLIELTALGG